MVNFEEHRLRRVPPRALILSLLALTIPVAASFLASDAMREYAALFWLLALVPGFLLAYYRGWRGVATALAAGMATLSLTQVAVLIAGLPIPDILLGVVAAYIVISLGIGWLAEAFHQDVEDVADLAFTDLLTRLPNRRHARVFLENEFAAAERGRLLAVVLFDLDGFKDYNDRYGHQAGDEALKLFGEVLSSNTRRMNLSARFGGEEFLSILTASDEQGAVAFAERIRRRLKETSLPRGRLTLSAGIAPYHPSMTTPDQLLAAADHALYRAKHEGRDSVRLFGRRMIETLPPTPEAEPYEGMGEAGPHRYPRNPDEMGHTPPPAGLLGHRSSGLGEGRRVLLFGEDEALRHMIGSYLLRERFDVLEARTPPAAGQALEGSFDLVVSDLTNSGGDGVDIIRTAKSRWPETPVIVVARLRDSHLASEALAAGADHFLHHPFGPPELRERLFEALDASGPTRTFPGATLPVREADDGWEDASVPVPSPVISRDGRGSRPALDLAQGSERRDPYMEGHSERVWMYARILADALDPASVRLDRFSLELGCRLHDVGRLELEEEIVQKRAPLTAEETSRIREHPAIGRRILASVVRDPVVLDVVGSHHEWWDGTGYPEGLVGASIPYAARLVALADSLDAMTCPRPHRPALSWGSAIDEIHSRSGSQFDPDMVRALESSLDALRAVHDRHVVRTPA